MEDFALRGDEPFDASIPVGTEGVVRVTEDRLAIFFRQPLEQLPEERVQTDPSAARGSPGVAEEAVRNPQGDLSNAVFF